MKKRAARKSPPKKRAAKKKSAGPSDLELRFMRAWQLFGLTDRMPYEREHRFHTSRRWRLDFAWPDSMVAVECEGGIFPKRTVVRGRQVTQRGGHASVAGILRDIEKYNAAQIAGWMVLRITTKDLDLERDPARARRAVRMIANAVQARQGSHK